METSKVAYQNKNLLANNHEFMDNNNNPKRKRRSPKVRCELVWDWVKKES